MNSTTLQRQLAALPARQLNLLAIGALAVAVALALSAVRAPLAQLRVQRARVAALAAEPAAFVPDTLRPTPAPAAPKAPPAPTPLALIGALSAGAQAAGVTVASAVPGAERGVAGLRQQTLDVEASGSYAAILDWIAGIEVTQPAVGVIRLELAPAPETAQNQAQDEAEPGARRLVKLRLGLYSTGGQP